MPKNGHTEEQIIAALKQYESGEKVADICRKLGISQASFYTWKKQYAGMGVHRAARAAATEGGKRQAEAGGGGSDAGQRGVERSAVKNVWSAASLQAKSDDEWKLSAKMYPAF